MSLLSETYDKFKNINSNNDNNMNNSLLSETYNKFKNPPSKEEILKTSNQKSVSAFKSEEQDLYKQQAIQKQQAMPLFKQREQQLGKEQSLVTQRNLEIQKQHPYLYKALEIGLPIAEKIVNNPVTESLSSFGQGIESGASLGLIPKVREMAMPEIQKGMQKDVEKQPLSYTLGELSGYVFPGNIFGKIAGKITKPLSNKGISNIAKTAIQEAIAGGGMGATEGTIKGETPEQIKNRALQYAAFGGGGAAILGGIAKGTKALFNTINKEFDSVFESSFVKGKNNIPVVVPSLNAKTTVMSQQEFDDVYGLNKPLGESKVKNLIGDMGKEVIKKNGTQDIGELLTIYKQKYNLPDDIKVKFPLNKDVSLGTTIPKRDINGNLVGATINLNLRQPLDIRIGTLRHELEHIKDLNEGYIAPKESPPNIQGLTAKQYHEQLYKGHNKNYGWFEPEYLYKSLIEAKEPRMIAKDVNAPTTSEVLPQQMLRQEPQVKTQNTENMRPTITEPAPMREQISQPQIETRVEKPVEIQQQKPKYSTEIEAKIKAIDDDIKNYTKNKKEHPVKMNSGLVDLQQTEKDIKGYAMRRYAEKREIIQGDRLHRVKGGLTDKELEMKIKKENSNYIGKKVITSDGEGTIISTPAYGKSKVEFSDGTTKFYTNNDIQPKETVEQMIARQKSEQQAKTEPIVQFVEQPKILKPKESTVEITAKPKALKPKTEYKISENQPVKTVEPEAQNIANQLNQITQEPLKGQGKVFERGASRSTRTDLNMNEDVRKIFDANPEFTQTLNNKDTIASAQKKFDKGYEQAYTEFMEADMRDLRADDVVLAKLIANESGKKGLLVQARNVIVKIAEKLTESGQISQAQNIFRRSDPATFDAYIKKQLDRINDEGKRIYGESKWKNIELDPELHKEIYNLNLYDENVMNDTMRRVYNDIQGQQPQTIINKINGFRRMGMLLNPSTHISNLAGNSLLSGARKSDDLIAQGLELFIKKENRTRAIGWSSDKNLVSKVDDVWNRYGKDISANTRYELTNINPFATISRQDAKLYTNRMAKFIADKTGYTPSNKIMKKIVDEGILESLNQASYKSLNWEDNIFLRTTFKDTLGQYMKAKGMKEVTQEAIDYAKKKAYEYTFKESGVMSNALTRWKSSGGALGIATEATIPFHKTPINVAKVAYRHSPLGFISLLNVVKALGGKGLTTNQRIDIIAKGMTGTAVAGLGYYMAMNGMLSIEKRKGYNEYVANTPIGKYTFDWASPVAVPLAMGIAVKDAVEKNNKLKHTSEYSKILDGFLSGTSAGINVLVDNTIIGTAVDLVKYKGLGEQALDIPRKFASQGIPRALQIATKVIDPIPRETKTDISGNKVKNPTIYGEIVSRLPVISRTLPKKKDKNVNPTEGLVGQLLPGRKIK
jgi:hypothetical protein